MLGYNVSLLLETKRCFTSKRNLPYVRHDIKGCSVIHGFELFLNLIRGTRNENEQIITVPSTGATGRNLQAEKTKIDVM